MIDGRHEMVLMNPRPFDQQVTRSTDINNMEVNAYQINVDVAQI